MDLVKYRAVVALRRILPFIFSTCDLQHIYTMKDVGIQSSFFSPFFRSFYFFSSILLLLRFFHIPPQCYIMVTI